MSEATARKRGRRGSPESWSVDAHVGQRVRMRRTLLGMSQEKLGEAIGLTFQQVQKYERGSNRISAGTLYRLGQVLDVPVSFFFDSYDDPSQAQRPRGDGEEPAESGTQISRREARLLRLWRAAPSHVSDELLALLSALSPGIREMPEEPDSDGGEMLDGGQTALPSYMDGHGAAKLPPAQPVDAEAVRSSTRQTRGDSSRAKAAKLLEAQGDKGKPRRRHGAVWDPTDILRASKPSTRG
ncbi:transcriptional regulator with XRE-family HTH domain [Azospirillum picis]|uniref:Transcriptional regulator with XRE-family HTH domain n=1 Tax=Azospirillum picis TaxID=488438 RepID=A0ABU0MEC0_9PROT|nr:transcriptional regulator with XRE-family HTH domain [Azospirillum picis]MDQ0531757.1 transcriptional regulator with XRE-family HTH domain [Azospirillum picis]